VVETGGLENRCTGNRTGGSNPSPSATQSEPQRMSAVLALKYANNARIWGHFPNKSGWRDRTTGPVHAGFCAFFSWKLTAFFFAELRQGRSDQGS